MAHTDRDTGDVGISMRLENHKQIYKISTKQIRMDELSEVMYWEKQRMKDSILEYSETAGERKGQQNRTINIEKKNS